MSAPDPFARLLVEEGLVSAIGVERAQARQAQAGGALDTALLEMGLADEAVLAGALARASGLPPMPEGGLSEPDPRSRRVFPAKVAERHGLAPFALDGRELLLAASYPVDVGLLDEVGFMLSLHLRPCVAPEWRVRTLIERLYGTPVPERLRRLAARLAGGVAEEGEEVAPAAASREDIAFEPAEPATPGPEPARRNAGQSEPLAAALAQAVELSEAREILAEPPPAAAAAIDRSAPPRWSLAEARAALSAARDRDQVVVTALRYVRDFFEFAALFAVTRDAVWGHDALSPDEDARQRTRAVAVAVDECGLFLPVLQTRGPYLGPVGQDPATASVLDGLERGVPRTVLLYPVALRERVVCIVYADNGEAPVSARRLGDLLLFLSAVGGALERILRERRRTSGGGEAPAPPPPAGPSGREAWQVAEPGRLEPPLPESVEVDLGDYEVGAAADVLAADAVYDFAGAADRLAASARGSAERGSLIAQLVERAPEAAPFLAAGFPGPVEVRSEALAEATPVYEQGPLLAALAAMGTAATPHLVPLLGDPDRRRRRYAVLLLGHLADPSALPDLAEAVFDPDARVASAARGALAALRRDPAMGAVTERLRRALGEPGRAAAAARALARLGEVESVPLLIQLLDAGEPAASAASEALTRLALQPLSGAADWTAWWSQHRGEPRRLWLLSGLTDPDRTVRRLAAEELRAAGTPPVSYYPDAPPAERERVARAWAAWLEEQGPEA